MRPSALQGLVGKVVIAFNPKTDMSERGLVLKAINNFKVQVQFPDGTKSIVDRDDLMPLY